MTPRDIDAMSLWEFQACMDGWKAANSSEETKPIMDDATAAALGIEGFD